MKKKQKEEIRAKTAPELRGEIEKRRKELLQLRMEISLGKVKNTNLAKTKADELAVIRTVLQEKKFQEKQV